MVLDHSATASRNILAGPRRGGLGGGAPQAPNRNHGPAPPPHANMAAANPHPYRHDPYRSDFSRIEVSPQRDGGSTTISAMKVPPRPQFWGPAYGAPQQHPNQSQMYHPQQGGAWQPQQQQHYGYFGEQHFQQHHQQQQQQYNYSAGMRPAMPPSPPLPPSALAAPFVPQSAGSQQQQQQQAPPQPQPPKILSPLAAALTASYPTSSDAAALAAATKGALIGAGIAAAGAYQHPSFDAGSSLTAGLADGNERSVSGGAQSLAPPRSARTEASVMSSSGPAPALEAANGDEPTAQQQGLECQHLLDHVSYAPVSAVRDATRHGESRKVGTRIGEAIAPWEAPEAGPGAGSSTHYRGEPLTTVFVAQLPFDLPLSAMQHVADAAVPGPRLTLLQGAPHMRKGRAYDGCAFFRMPESDAARFVAAIHKRVLFDVDGVWVAQSDEQQQRLISYCRWMQEKRPDERRRLLPRPTPFSAMTAEYALRGMPRQVQQQQAPNPMGFGNFSGNQHPPQPFGDHNKGAGQDSRRIFK